MYSHIRLAQATTHPGRRTAAVLAALLVATLGGRLAAAESLGTDQVWLSDLPWTAVANGWGPAEKDHSNGEQAAGDGRTLSVGGATSAKGLGVHAASEVRVALAGGYTAFTSDLGVDDEVGARGSVVFQVLVDGVKRYDSGVVTGAMARLRATVDLTGAKELRLLVGDAGDNIHFDHADWAGAVLTRKAAGITYAAPLTISVGGTYSGNWQAGGGRAAITIATSAPVTILDSRVRGAGALIVSSVGHCKLTVRNTSALGSDAFTDTRFIDVESWDSLLVDHCTLENTSGIYAAHYAGNRTAQQTVVIRNNRALNIIGDRADLLQFFQMNHNLGLVGSEIAWNQVINEPGRSQVEDNISIYESSGTATSPIRIHDNYVQGGYARDPVGRDYSGGGIMAGDGQDGLSSFIEVAWNQVVSTSNYGIAISSGHHSTIHDNRILSCGLLPDGRRIPYQNVGLYIWDSYHNGKMSNNTARANQIGWVLGSGRNDSWTPDAASNSGQIAWPGAITQATEVAELQLWRNKLASNGQAVGSDR